LEAIKLINLGFKKKNQSQPFKQENGANQPLKLVCTWFVTFKQKAIESTM